MRGQRGAASLRGSKAPERPRQGGSVAACSFSGSLSKASFDWYFTKQRKMIHMLIWVVQFRMLTARQPQNTPLPVHDLRVPFLCRRGQTRKAILSAPVIDLPTSSRKMNSMGTSPRTQSGLRCRAIESIFFLNTSFTSVLNRSCDDMYFAYRQIRRSCSHYSCRVSSLVSYLRTNT